MKLTLSQKKAVSVLGKHTLISAGAGTGKTRVLVERVFNLVTQRSVPLSEILVLTFTEKAAGEIKQRLSKRFLEAQRVQARAALESAAISTFHGFAAKLLREHPIEAGVDPDFRVLENEETDIFKEDALYDWTANLFELKTEGFRFFEIYGEEAAQTAILDVYHAACHQGVGLVEYFAAAKKIRLEKLATVKNSWATEAESYFQNISDKVKREEWQGWFEKVDWSWQAHEDFLKWIKKHGTSPKLTPWKDFSKEWASWRLEFLADEALNCFEQAALGFEKIYQQKKDEQQGLDFDDLQIRALKLVKGDSPGSKTVANALRRSFRHVFVDEFQDTSYLQMAFVQFLMPAAEVFLVGDYKQSIYGFRGAEPELFREQEAAFEKSEDAVRLALADNFRSDPPILEFSNAFFKRVWEEDSSFRFDALCAAKDEGQVKNKNKKPEVIVIPESDDGDKAEARLKEGAAIAARIQALRAEGFAYGDMVLLFSGMTHSALYEYALRQAQIPYLSVSGASLYSQPEIRDLISFLECLQNPLADVPLAALLRSPFVRVNDETLFWLAENAKSKHEKNPLYEGLSRFREIKEIHENEKQKLEVFWSYFQDWRRRKDAVRLSDLLEEAIEKTGYVIWALAQAPGVRRYSHIRKFIQLARRQEGRGRLSAHDFLRLVKRLQFQEVRSSDTMSDDDDIDAVRLMTLHKAKGLEFPVVFLADLGSKKNTQQSSPVIAVPHEGFALKLKNSLTGENEPTWFFNQLNQFRKARGDAERKRLFYVGVTRAENRLILSGVWKEAKKEKETYAEMSSWMDWVMQARDLIEETSAAPLEIKPALLSGGAYADKPHFQILLKEIISDQNGMESISLDLPQAAEQVMQRIQSVKPAEFSKVIDLPVSAYVLFAKDPEQFWNVYGRGWSLPQWDHLADSPEVAASEEPASTENSARFEDAADFGTRMHRALEFVNWSDPQKSLDPANLDKVFMGFSEAKRNEASGILSGFFKTDLFREIHTSKLVRRELNFVLNARRGLIDGVIDLLCQNKDGSYSVLDYKTAEGDAAKTVERGYDLQIKIYALAATKILNQPVTRGRVYYLKNQCAVDVPLADFAKIESDVNELQLRLLEFVKAKWK